MNGSLINNNFVVGMLLAKDLSRQDQLLVGLSAGQMGSSSAVGIVGLKQLVDETVSAQAALAECQASKGAEVGKAVEKREHRHYNLDEMKKYKDSGGSERRKHYLESAA